MKLTPSNSNNYNGIVHPEFLNHLKPFIEGMPVRIYGNDIPDSSAMEWAGKGMLESISRFNAYTTYEAMIIKGMGKELAGFIRDNDKVDPSLSLIPEYYFGDPQSSMSALLKVLGDPEILVEHINLISSICIQDLEFTDSCELEKFLLKDLNAKDRKEAGYALKYHLHNYLRDPADIKTWRDSSTTASDWVKLATFHAHTGDQRASRRSLDKARWFAGRDFVTWQMISQNYLFLLGDFDGFYSAMQKQIDTCDDTFSFLMTAEDLASFIGGDDALDKSKELLNCAEICSSDVEEYELVADAWENLVEDVDRANYCRDIAENMVSRKNGDFRGN
jgi:hypothetical protein